MKSVLLMVALLAIGLSISGCTYHADYNYTGNVSVGNASNASVPHPNATPPSGGQPAAPSGGTQPAENNTGVAGGSGTQPSPPENATQPSGGNASPSGPDLTGKTYRDLINSGSPSQCSMSYQSESGKMDLSLYFDGNGRMRIEQPATGASDCPSAVLVFRGDASGNGTLYFNCPGTPDALGHDFKTDNACAWDSMEISTDYGGIGGASIGLSNYSSPSLEYVQSPVYECRGWSLDPTKFDTPGFVCSR